MISKSLIIIFPIIYLFIILYPISSNSSENLKNQNFELAIAAGIEAKKMRSTFDSADAEGLLFSSSVTYKFHSKFHIGITSLMQIGYSNDMDQHVQGSLIQGENYYRGMSFGPLFRYLLPISVIKERWKTYIECAPLFEIFTVEPLDKVTVQDGNYHHPNPIKYEGSGGMFSIGLIRNKNREKKTRAIFFRLIYKYIAIRRLSVTEDRDEDETKIIHKERIDRNDLREQAIAFQVGVILF